MMNLDKTRDKLAQVTGYPIEKFTAHTETELRAACLNHGIEPVSDDDPDEEDESSD